MHGFGQIAFKGDIGFSSSFDIVKHFFLLHLENIDVQIKIFNFDPKPWVVLFGKSNRVFSHDVKAAILVSQNNETAAMLVSQTSPVGVELFSYASAFFCSNKFCIDAGHVSEHALHGHPKSNLLYGVTVVALLYMIKHFFLFYHVYLDKTKCPNETLKFCPKTMD